MPLASRTPFALLAASVFAFAAAAEPPAVKPVSPAEPSVRPASPPATEAGRIDLRPRFELGKVVRYTMKQVSDQQVPNAEDPKDPHKTRLEQNIGLKMTTKAIDKETGEATVELVYESVKAKLDSPLSNVDFDSTKTAPAKTPGGKAPAPASSDPFDAVDNMVLEQFKKMVGTTMTMKVAKDGRITSVAGGESLAPAIPGLPGTGDAMKNLGGLFGPITTNSSKGFDGFARIGERWTHKDGLSVEPLGELDLTTTYDLRSHAGNLAKVYFNGRVESRSNTAGSPVPVGVEGAEHKGLYSWDTRQGQLVHCEMEQKTTLSGTLTGGQPSIATTSLVFDRVDKK